MSIRKSESIRTFARTRIQRGTDSLISDLLCNGQQGDAVVLARYRERIINWLSAEFIGQYDVVELGDIINRRERKS